MADPSGATRRTVSIKLISNQSAILVHIAGILRLNQRKYIHFNANPFFLRWIKNEKKTESTIMTIY